MVNMLWDSVRQEKLSVGVIIGGLVLAWTLFQWTDARFLTEAEAHAIGDIKHTPMIQADVDLAKQVEENTELLQTHIVNFDEYQQSENIKEIQALINDTNDKLFELQRFPEDTRRSDQERELLKRLSDYELRKQCLLENNTSCD